MIKKYSTESEYNSAGYPTTESRVAQIASTSEVKIDGVNVMTKTPVLGDAVYKKGDKYYFFKGGKALNNTNLVANGYEGLGQIIGYRNGKAIFLDKNIASAQYLSVWQYAITEISSTSITIGLYMKGDDEKRKDTAITLSSTTLDATTASEISDALNESGNTGNIGYANHGYWAYYDGENNRIIVQCDFPAKTGTKNYNQYPCYGSGCSIELCVWEDMPEAGWLCRNKMIFTYYGGMNFTRFKTFNSDKGKTPTTQVAISSIDIVNQNSFNTSEYCSTIRELYGDYDTYLRANMVRRNQKFGMFSLLSGLELTRKYGNKTVTKKDGTIVYKFPALHYPLTIGYGVTGLGTGDLYFTGVEDGMIFMDDANMDIINATRTKMGHTNISNRLTRIFAQRGNYFSSNFFDGTKGVLASGTSVIISYGVQGAALLDI